MQEAIEGSANQPPQRLLGLFLHGIQRGFPFFVSSPLVFFFRQSCVCMARIAFIPRTLSLSLSLSLALKIGVKKWLMFELLLLCFSLFCFVVVVFFFMFSLIFVFAFQNSSNASTGDFECFLKEFQLVSELDQIFCFVCF